MKLVLLIFTLTFSFGVGAATLKDVTTSTENGIFEAKLTFDGPVSRDQASLDYINETIQLNIAKSQIGNTKTLKIQDENIKSLYFYQANKDLARARVIYKKGINAGKFQSGTSLDINDNQVVIRIDPTLVASKKESLDVGKGNDAVSDEDLKQATAWIENANQKMDQVSAKGTVQEKEKTDINKREADIPVLSNKISASEQHKPISGARVFLSLGLILGLIAGFSLFMKKVLRKTPLAKNSQIKVLTQYYLGPKKSLAIVRVAGESILIGVTDQNINLIKSLALLDEEIPQEETKDFSKSFKDIFNKKKTNEDVTQETDESEDFAFSKIKDAISGKLKNMKEI